MGDRGGWKSVTACFNTWNACDFEVDKGSQGGGEMLSTVFRGYEISRRWVIDVSVIGHEVIGGVCVCALCSGNCSFPPLSLFFSPSALDSMGLIGSLAGWQDTGTILVTKRRRIQDAPPMVFLYLFVAGYLEEMLFLKWNVFV